MTKNEKIRKQLNDVISIKNMCFFCQNKENDLCRECHEFCYFLISHEGAVYLKEILKDYKNPEFIWKQ